MSSPSCAIVIGAGIAGISVAALLSDRGWKITILEREARIATQASGNQAGIIAPYVLSNDEASARYLGPAFQFTLELFAQLKSEGHAIPFNQTGIVQLPATKRISRMVREAQAGTLKNDLLRAVSQEEASELSGLTLKSAALFYPQGGWVRPQQFCKLLLERALRSGHVKIHHQQTVTKAVSKENGWEVFTSSGEKFSGDVVVVANAYECSTLAQTAWLPIEQVRGLIAVVNPSASTQRLRSVVSHNGYLIPYSDAEHILGATYRHGVFHRERDLEEEAELFGNLEKWVLNPKPTLKSARVCFRASTFDRLGFIGEMQSAEGEIMKGLYVSVGHGSRGLISAPFGAFLLASIICGDEVHAANVEVAVQRLGPRHRNSVHRNPVQSC